MDSCGVPFRFWTRRVVARRVGYSFVHAAELELSTHLEFYIDFEFNSPPSPLQVWIRSQLDWAKYSHNIRNVRGLMTKQIVYF